MAGSTGKAKSERSFRLSTPLVACFLMFVSTLQAMAAISSKDKDGTYPYKVIASTLLSELFKLVTSAVMLAVEIYSSSESREVILTTTLKTTPMSLCMAMVPGFAYQILNNLNFVTLYYVDAPTFQILGNLKIVATGIAGQLLLNRYLTRGKWLALTLLTLGAAISQIPQPTPDESGDCNATHWFSGRFMGYFSALVCVFLSATMGVFTEMYMKGNPASIHWQNLQLYLFGILANAAALLYRDEIGPSAPTPILHGFNAGACVATISNGFCGLAVSFMLRYADSIAKTYATALAIPCTSVAAYVLFNTQISVPNMLGSGVMVISLLYYYFGEVFFAPLSSKEATPESQAAAAKLPK